MIQFTPIEPPSKKSVTLQLNGRTIDAIKGETIASVLLKRGLEAWRNHPVSGAPRSAYCLMGVCFECLVEIDGIKNRRACQTLVHDGMIVSTDARHDASA